MRQGRGGCYLFGNNGHCSHAVRKKESFSGRVSGDEKLWVCSRFQGIRNRRHLQAGQVVRKNERRSRGRKGNRQNRLTAIITDTCDTSKPVFAEADVMLSVVSNMS